MRTTSGSKTVWLSSEIDFLLDNYECMTNAELAQELGMKLTKVRTKLYELGHKRMEMEYWTDEQVLFLKENYQVMGDVEMAEGFNQMYYKAKSWSKKHIEKKRRQLNLKRTEAEKDAIRDRNTAQGRFKVSHWKRWFERTTPVGEIRIWMHYSGRPYMVIKQEAGFVHYAPWLWEQNFGPIPEGMLIRPKDNNPLNMVPENLECITRAEHARRNAEAYHAYPPELKQAMKLINKLTKKINEYGNEEHNGGHEESRLRSA
jgi:hypothetical protein